MTEVLFPIKGQLFGGFHRQDVINYIEKTNSEKNQLRKELDQADAKLRELEDTVESLKARLSQMEEQGKSYESEREETASQLTQLRQELEVAKTELNEKRREELSEALKAATELKESFFLVKGLVTSRTASLKRELNLASGELNSMDSVMNEAERKICELLSSLENELK